MSKKGNCVSTENKCGRFSLTEEIREKLTDLPDILEFVENLLEYVGKYKKKIKALKSKIKGSSLKVDVAVQTNSEPCDIKNETKETIVESVESITEDITKAAEQAIQNSGFVYEETSGMYYDYATGYYYNAEYGLYYDGNTGTYLQYNQDTNSYEYYSQAYTDTQDTTELKLPGHNSKRKGQVKIKTKVKTSDLDHLTNSFNNMNIDRLQNLAQGVTKRWPPCMRIIVEESSVPNLKKGSLHIITFEGGSIGREGDRSLLIPDINISKHHLNILYNKDSNMFQAVDMGSRNGTILNGARMSTSKQESENLDVVHGSRIQLGSTILLCHVHEGSQTCGHCEPGLLKQNESDSIEKIATVVKRDCHRKELKNLKKKFGMNNFQTDKKSVASKYTDRAQKRRDVIGSQNEHEKTQASSVDESISSKNKGFQLLSKMGWKEGQSLGKEGQGILEPIKLIANDGTAGVGSIAGVGSSKHKVVAVTKTQKRKEIIWKKTQERFDKLQDASTIFEDSE